MDCRLALASRARANAVLIAPDRVRRSAVWAWLGWWVPVVCLWFPKQIVDDSWQITSSAAAVGGRGRYRDTNLWWGLWIAHGVASNAASNPAIQKGIMGMRSMLREYYPAALDAFGDDLAGRDALAVLAAAPDPDQAVGSLRPGSRSLLRKAGRQRNVTTTRGRDRASAAQRAATARAKVVRAYAASASALVAVLTAMADQTGVLAEQVKQGFGQHPDAEIYLSQPGLGIDPRRPGARRVRRRPRPLRRRPGPEELLRHGTDHPRLRHQTGRAGPLRPQPAARPTPCYQQAFSALNASPGARAFYDRQRARGATHHQALRALANRLVGILHGCLRHHTLYDEHRLAQRTRQTQPAA